MSDFFTRLIQATYEHGASLRPRPVAHFEQLPSALPLEPERFEPEPPAAATEGKIRPVGQTLRGLGVAFQPASSSEVRVRTIDEGAAAQEARPDAQVATPAPIARAALNRARNAKPVAAPPEEAGRTAPPLAGQRPPDRAPTAPRQPALYLAASRVSAPLAQEASDRGHAVAADSGDDRGSTLAARTVPRIAPLAAPVRKFGSSSMQAPFAASTHSTQGDEPSRPIALRSQRPGGELQADAAAPALLPETSSPQGASHQAGPVIRVTIGRIVVKAEAASAPPNPRLRQAQSSSPALSLTDYLNARDGLNARNGLSARNGGSA